MLQLLKATALAVGMTGLALVLGGILTLATAWIVGTTLHNAWMRYVFLAAIGVSMAGILEGMRWLGLWPPAAK